ncbi:vesicle transport protein SFT2A [Exaiptasia diaphana]|uniref:Vesicle transport protein n=1 Tax=Exaiptasia diaphana TaxID=2652724 RepID=A0A913XGH3_EXADI|nr:vesicle transport protein SFT2A [Exaiptasia diaphana]KXJ26097.1 Vesicle transport protein SFT2B [Exaiptasia diaphana]
MAPSTIQKLKSAITGEQQDDSLITEINDATTLSWSTRIKGFIICFIVGVFCSVLGVIFLWKDVRLFAVFYSIGNVVALASTCFLMGPCKQLKNMFKEKRLIATIIMLTCLVLTLCAALWWSNKGLALVFCILQYFAMTWYCLSYIPFARDAVKKLCTSCLA